eukprot:2698633-Prymnesium_polylepis.1
MDALGQLLAHAFSPEGGGARTPQHGAPEGEDEDADVECEHSQHRRRETEEEGLPRGMRMNRVR